jgi:uncharacterized protein YlxW (UPF0749 family)
MGDTKMNFLVSMLGINKIWVYVGIGVLVLSIVGGTYLVWKRGIEQAALLKFNQDQLEQTIKDQEVFRQRQQELEEHQRVISRQLQDENRRLRSRVENIQTILNSTEMSANDRPASDILRRTIEELRNTTR